MSGAPTVLVEALTRYFLSLRGARPRADVYSSDVLFPLLCRGLARLVRPGALAEHDPGRPGTPNLG
ncbi:hypothetical protein GCM10009551_063940 [Nocardiopsis tropica]